MIIVKSIEEKPEECRGCKLFDESTYDCLINSESPAYITCEEQYEHCPIEEAPDINVGNMDITTHDSIPAETGENDVDGPSGDCISRQAVTKFLNDWLSCLFENCHKQSASDLKMIIKDFKNLPSAQPEQRWIPVTERLPEEYGEYLVTYKSDGEQIFMDIIEYETSFEYDHEKNRFKGNWLFADDWQAVNSEVIAWMPLPEPYQERGEQE